MTVVHEPQVTYRDYDAMLTDPNVDAASRTLQAGKHVLVEEGDTVEAGQVVGLIEVMKSYHGAGCRDRHASGGRGRRGGGIRRRIDGAGTGPGRMSHGDPTR